MGREGSARGGGSWMKLLLYPFITKSLKEDFFFGGGGQALILFRINTAEELMINNLLS